MTEHGRASGIATRLAVPAIAAWLAAMVLVGATEYAPATAVACWSAAVGGCIVLLLRGPRRASWPGIAIVTALAAGCVASAIAIAAPARTPELLLDAADSGRRISVLVRVDEKVEVTLENRAPWTSDRHGTGATRMLLVGTAVSATIAGDRHELAVPVTVFAPGDESRPGIGSFVEASGSLERADPGERTAFLIFCDEQLETSLPPPWYLGWAADLRASFATRSSELPGMGGDLLPGLATGETSAVGEELDQAMTSSSLSHLTAVSGANCAVVVAAITLLLAAARAPRWLRVSGALIALAGFVVLVTPEPSVVRAALMATAVLIALAAGRPTAGLAVLVLVVIGIVTADPWMSRSYGFALSALATAGLLILARPAAELLARWMPRAAASILAIPLSAQLACQPVLLLLDPSIPLYGVIANLLAGPAAPVATILGLVGCLLLPFFPPLADAAIWLGWIPSSWIAGVATTTSGLPFARLPWLPGAGGVVVFTALTALVLLWMHARLANRLRVAAITGLTVVAVVTVYSGVVVGEGVGSRLALPPDWRIAMCDIGQGDAVVVRSAGAVALIDTGPEPEPLRECLGRLSIERIDLLVLTHFDLDHIGGVGAVVGRVDRALVGSPENHLDDELLGAIERSGGTVDVARAGMTGVLGDVRWTVVWPRGGATTMNTGNAGSVVMVAEGDGIRSIFLGDLDETAQDALLATGAVRGRFDVVKVAHHGSRDQSARFYESLDARVALISVGADNTYGHPAASILGVLRATGSAVVRTDRDGMAAVGVTEGRISLWSELARPP